MEEYACCVVSDTIERTSFSQETFKFKTIVHIIFIIVLCGHPHPLIKGGVWSTNIGQIILETLEKLSISEGGGTVFQVYVTIIM